ncbi:MAG: ATP-binding protein [Bryobacteraceae bacterium]|jgi:signal transduction histidine kinase
MNFQAKLTLGAVVLETVIVAVISAVDLGNVMQIEFVSAENRAALVRDVATEYVAQILNRQPPQPLREALRDPALPGRLQKMMTESNELIEIAVVDPQNQILADSDADRVGVISPRYHEFDELVNGTTWIQKLKLLGGRENTFYQMEKALAREGAATPLVYVRVVVFPSLIVRHFIWPALRHSAETAMLLFAGSVGLIFVISAIAFRRLGQLGHMLDLAASGQYEPEKNTADAPANDELSVMASKVSLLSERLRGAQFEVSDLRGNIDRLLLDLEDAVFIFDREMRLMFASGSVEKFLGKEREELVRLSLSAIFPPNTTLGLLIAQAAQTGRFVRNRRVPLTALGGGASVVLLSVDMLESIPGATGSGLLVRLRDPEAQRKLGHELQTADRLAAISRVSGGVAHEVKNPLNAILLHVEVAKAKLARGDTDVIPQMEIISSEILRLDRVVKTFLDFTRPVELRLETVPVRRLLEEVLELARPQAEAAKIRVIVGEEADGVEVRIDRDLLQQAMLNIVVNAMQAMPEGGELRFDSIAGEEFAEIRISDTGAGIPPELRDKIFRLYFTTKKEGSGIGLAMTFRIVQLHDGTIDFTSEPGKGTTFSIRLPIAS